MPGMNVLKTVKRALSEIVVNLKTCRIFKVPDQVNYARIGGII